VEIVDVTSVFRRRDLGNFRLVSLTLMPEKVMERIFPEAIFKHVKDKRITGNSQNGFKMGKSSFTNLIAF